MGGAAALLLAPGAAGCGGGSTPSAPSFADRANAICRREARAVRALPVPQSYAQLREVADRRSALVRRELAGLAALDPPAALRPRLRGLAAAIRDELAAAEELRVAGLSGDTESAQGALYRGTRAAVRAARLARRLGLPDCAGARIAP